MGACCPLALTETGEPKASSAAAPEHKHSVTAKASLYLYIRGTSPCLHELFQACSGLLHVSADVFALQAVCINLHDIDEGLDASEQVPDCLLAAACCPVCTRRLHSAIQGHQCLIQRLQLQQRLRSCILCLRAWGDGPCKADSKAQLSMHPANLRQWKNHAARALLHSYRERLHVWAADQETSAAAVPELLLSVSACWERSALQQRQ